MSIIENVKAYFNKKRNEEEVGLAPEGVCPNCWGKQEWEGEFYKKTNGKSITKNSDIYDNFINQVVEKLDKITLKEDIYICETCNMKYDK